MNAKYAKQFVLFNRFILHHKIPSFSCWSPRFATFFYLEQQLEQQTPLQYHLNNTVFIFNIF